MITITAATSLLLACGWGIAGGHATTLFVAVAIAGLVALALTKRGACIGVLLLAAMNGLPLINTSQIVVSKLTMEDVATMALILMALIWLLLENAEYRPSRAGRAISRAAGLLVLWWLVTVTRSVAGDHVPILRAVAFGRDFLYFGLLLLLLPRVRMRPRDIAVLLGVLASAASLFAIGQVLTATGHGPPGALIHYEFSAEQSGFTRVYSNMTDLVNAALAISLGACLFARERAVRLYAAPVALLLTISVVVQLTRARWIGLIAGLLLVGIWIALRGERRVAPMLRKRLLLALGTIAALVLGVVLIAPGIASGGTIFQRLLSIFSDLESSGGTVAVRAALTKVMIGYLGESWPIGLGLLPPHSHYFVGLRAGSIRDPDVGVLNALMTMGAVGAFLIYCPAAFTIADCLRRSERRVCQFEWLRYGGAVWLVATIVSSLTLVTLFSASGLVLTAVILTVLVHPEISGIAESLLPMRSGRAPRRSERRIATTRSLAYR